MDTPKRILVVEDEPLIAMLMEGYLDMLGMEVLDVVGSVEDALSSLDVNRPDAVVLDVHLSRGMRCDPVAERLCAIGVPFMFSSGDPVAPDPWSDRPILPKPYTIGDVERVLSALGLEPAQV